MEASVIICTYNRCESLRLTLESLCGLEAPSGLGWELIVVDNNSTDETKTVCDRFATKLPLRYIFERTQGQSAARNRGIREATGKLLVFTDDDVDLDRQWLAALWTAACDCRAASFFGGKSIPHWEVKPPRWVLEHSATTLRGVTVHYENGEQPRFLSESDIPFFGANMAFQKAILQQPEPFREDLGLKGKEPTRQEETVLMHQIQRDGHKGYYVPGAIVYHRNPPERATERYVRKWYKGAGISKVRLREIADSERKLLSAPGYLWRKLSVYARLYLLTRCTCPSSIWLPAEIAMAETWGMICEFRRQARRGLPKP